MERIVKISPAFDRMTNDPQTNQGIGSCSMYIVLKGEKGAVVFTIMTDWYLKETEPWLQECSKRMGRTFATGAAVSYCSPCPLSEYQKNHGRENCDWLGCTCYGDVGFTLGDEVFELLTRNGSEAVWKWLENYYKETFEITENIYSP